MPTQLIDLMETFPEPNCEKPDFIIPAQAVDRAKLYRLLKKTYGESDGHNNFRIEVSFVHRYICNLLLTNGQLRMNQYKVYRTNSSVKQVELTQVRDFNLTNIKL